MKRYLITGCGGFIGSHLAIFLSHLPNARVYGTVHHDRSRIPSLEGISTFHCDILDIEKLENITCHVEPNYIFHMAAQSRTKASWERPDETFEINVIGTLNLLESVRKANLDPRIVVACSAAEYGFSEDSTAMTEDAPLRPQTPYGVSKVAQDFLAQVYFQRYGLKIIRVRPFSITGPGAIGDTFSDLARGIAEIESGQKKYLTVGNVDSVRDITDVKDAVRVFLLLAEKGQFGEVYNLCSGIGYRVRELLQILINLSNREIEIIEADNRENSSLGGEFQIGDNSRLCSLGWSPQRSIGTTLADMLDYWRKRLMGSRSDTI